LGDLDRVQKQAEDEMLRVDAEQETEVGGLALGVCVCGLHADPV